MKPSGHALAHAPVFHPRRVRLGLERQGFQRRLPEARRLPAALYDAVHAHRRGGFVARAQRRVRFDNSAE